MTLSDLTKYSRIYEVSYGLSATAELLVFHKYAYSKRCAVVWDSGIQFNSILTRAYVQIDFCTNFWPANHHGGHDFHFIRTDSVSL